MNFIKYVIKIGLNRRDFYKSLSIYTLPTNVNNRVYNSTYTNNDPDAPVEMSNPFEKERKMCILCKMNITPDYKNIKLLSQFQSPYTGRIYGRHITGLCKRKQTEVQLAILKAQSCALMPTYHKDIDFLEDPKLFNPEKPLRPHKY